MSRAATRRRDDEGSVVYIYGVAERDSERKAKLSELEGVMAGSTVSVVAEGDLAALVSLVPAERFGPEGMRSAIEDTEWLRASVLAHETVLEALMPACTLVPFRFGIVCCDISRTTELLRVHGEALGRALARVRGAAEWGVKIHCDADTLRQNLMHSSRSLRTAQEALGLASPGVAFFQKKKLEQMMADELDSVVKSCAERSYACLAKCAREAMRLPVQASGWSTGSAETTSNAAYLVADANLAAFHGSLAVLQEEFAKSGFRYELSGPWPAYHFVSLDADRNTDGFAGQR